MDTMASCTGRPDAADVAAHDIAARKRDWTRVRRSGNFIAGILFGISLWIPIFVLTADDMQLWAQTGAFGAIGLFAAGCLIKIAAKSPVQTVEPDLSPVRCAVFKNEMPQRKLHSPVDHDQRTSLGD